MPLLIQANNDCKEFAALAAAVTDAHSSAIFLPSDLCAHHTTPSTYLGGDESAAAAAHHAQAATRRNHSIDLVAAHSASSLVRDCRVPLGSGVIGNVAEHGRSICISPCGASQYATGIYAENEPIASLVAVPISITSPVVGAPWSFGVLMCDSLRPDAFSATHIRILEHLARLVERLVFWAEELSRVTPLEHSWESFVHKTCDLEDAIGPDCVEALRVRVDSFHALEASIGLCATISHTEQFLRLIQQALPPHFPLMRLPNGEIIMCVDSMMGDFFAQKIQAIAQQLTTADKPLEITIERSPAKLARNGHCDLDATLQHKPVGTKRSLTLGGTRG